MHIDLYSLRYNPLSGGGSHQTLALMLASLVEAGHTVRLITLEASIDAAVAPCPVLVRPCSGGFFAQQRQVAALMRESQADVHLLYGHALLWAGGLYKRGGGTGAAVAYLNNYLPGMGLHRPRALLFVLRRRLWEKTFGAALMRHLDRLYFDSPVTQAVYESYGYHHARALMIPEFVDTKAFAALSRQPAPFIKHPDETHFVYAGRLSTDKGTDLLLQAASLLPRQVKVHIVGTGPMESAARAAANEQVHCYGWQSGDALAAFYQHADVFIHPCRWVEPFGRTIAEALACGAPVLATEGTGAAFVAGSAGMTFKNGDGADLIKKMQTLTDPATRAALAAHAPVRAHELEYRNSARLLLDDLAALSPKK